MKITGPHEGPSAPALQWLTTRPQSLVLTELIFFYACMFRIPLVRTITKTEYCVT